MKAYLSAIFLLLVFSVPFSYADYKQAVADYSQGRYEKAIQELKPDLERNPDWEFGHRLLGLCYLGLNNNALAANSLKRAVELKSPAFSAYYGLGQAYFNMKKYNECIDALNKGEALAAAGKAEPAARDGVLSVEPVPGCRHESHERDAQQPVGLG